jgi:anti-sigma factor RsiW
MRAHISEQDLTDYALNELDPHQRIYIESMLAVSEECRNDVYRMIDMAQLLEEGFEREAVFAERQDLHLKSEQRADLTRPHHRGHYIFRDMLSALGLAACVAFCLVHFNDEQFSGARTAAKNVATSVPSKVASVMKASVSDQAVESSIDLGKMLESLRELAAESSTKIMDASTDMLPESPEICTPPTRVMESTQLMMSDMP